MDTCADSKHWIPTEGANYPHLINGGLDKKSGETLYVGRGTYKSSVLPGKVYKGPKGAGLYVAADNGEQLINDYEMLVATKPMQWIPEHDGGYPLKAIPGGTDSDGNTLYIARAIAPDGEPCPGQLYPPHKRCVFSYMGKEYQKNIYDVLSEE